MKCRVVYKSDGSIAVIHPDYNSKKRYETEDAFLKRVYEKAMNNDPSLKDKDFDNIDTSALPSKEFRNAWTGSKGNPITIDEDKKNIIIEEMNRRE